MFWLSLGLIALAGLAGALTHALVTRQRARLDRARRFNEAIDEWRDKARLEAEALSDEEALDLLHGHLGEGEE